ncbi:MAG: hypothetical protein AB8H80_02100 [Planctomycetota bacterium]
MGRHSQIMYRIVIAFLLLAFAGSATAQKWRTEQVPEAGIEFEAPSRLERLPMQLGSGDLYRRARLRPKDSSDFVRAQYYWYCDVYEFAKTQKKPEEVKLPPGIPDDQKEKLREMLAKMGGRDSHKSFREWLDAKKNVEILVKGKAKRGKGKKLPYKHWVYIWDNKFGPVGLTYCEAAVYEVDGNEVALVVEMPLEKKKPLKPKSKWAGIIKRVMKSGKACVMDDAVATNDKRDKYADTPERKKALAEAKANIAGLQGWDYFTLPNYIVFYSWDFERPDSKSKARKEAIFYSERLEKMRSLYIESYPLDATGKKAIMPDPASIPGVGGPITGGTKEEREEAKTRAAEAAARAKEPGKEPYSVFRLCATYDQFQKYGQSPPGVVGWYSPSSKELVVFLGGDTMMGQGATETVTYHEGWHQFADFYFHPPESEKQANLHRWFDEGHGDYFGSFRWTGTKWKYVGSKMRYQDCKQMVRQEDYVPLKDIVRWTRRKFYGANAPYYYAQAYSMIDFLRRGEGSKGWDPRWAEVLDMYRKVALVKGDTKLGVDLAFRGFSPEDWTALETAWKAWVASGKFKKG